MGAECAYRRCQVRVSECRFKSLYDRSFNQERCTFADWSISRSVGQTGGLRFLSIPDIIALNRLVVSRSGARSGSASIVIKPEIIEYLVDAVQGSLFGIELYPSIYDKASGYAHGIISKHPFMDGNKRTGLLSAFTFLEINGYMAVTSLSNDEIVSIGSLTARGIMERNDLVDWLSRNVHS